MRIVSAAELPPGEVWPSVNKVVAASHLKVVQLDNPWWSKWWIYLHLHHHHWLLCQSISIVKQCCYFYCWIHLWWWCLFVHYSPLIKWRSKTRRRRRRSKLAEHHCHSSYRTLLTRRPPLNQFLIDNKLTLLLLLLLLLFDESDWSELVMTTNNMAQHDCLWLEHTYMYMNGWVKFPLWSYIVANVFSTFSFCSPSKWCSGLRTSFLLLWVSCSFGLHHLTTTTTATLLLLWLLIV